MFFRIKVYTDVGGGGGGGGGGRLKTTTNSNNNNKTKTITKLINSPKTEESSQDI